MPDQNLTKPILLLLEPEFEDQQYPGQRFFCRHCALLEGVLAGIAHLRERVEVRHVGFARPRPQVIALAGEDDQSLPKLVLPRGQHSPHASGEYAGRQIVSGSDRILAALGELYTLAQPHP